MPEEKKLEHAVTLASAFIKNGDIRIQNAPIREDSNPLLVLETLIVEIYKALGKVDECLADFDD
ncbi:hypothetical protein JYU06_02775 [Desulfotalea psychrophila]|uniref:Uncharacterized protein n=1 Tax=Desulfotalea psychrophila TaxID=84980 RepID=A0ABS3AUL8_9BACT|nr:hypothetical protein [Desulfotalea psychrophila]